VHVYEAQPVFTPDDRTLIVTPAWLELLDFDPGDAILNRTRTFELISRGATARITLKEPDVILERARFLPRLADRVRALGGRLTFGHRLERLVNDNGTPTLMFQTEAGGGREVPAAAVLGADGVESTVARAVGQDTLARVAIQQVRVPLPPDLPPDTVRIWFDRASTRFFYWLIPESPTTGALGLIAETPTQAERALTHFLAARDWAPIAAQPEQEAEVPLYPLRALPNASAWGQRVLLLGDAAGQVKVTTVGGMVTGMRGGTAAARALLRGTAYAAELRHLHRELLAHTVVRHVLDGFTDADYDRLLRMLNRRAAEVLSRYNRDELSRAIWPLLPAQPRWLLLGARALARRLVRGCRYDDVAFDTP
jgi:flavin-dependent dehydrogenase